VWRELVTLLLLAPMALPALALACLGIAWGLGAEPGERLVARVAVGATTLAAVCTAIGAGAGWATGLFPLEAGPWAWFSAAGYTFELGFLWDGVSVVMALVTTVLTALVVGFSVNYLHRESGFFRYFLLMLLFSAGMQWLVLSASYDQLLLGWEAVGLTSMLLVSFYREREQPVLAATRAMIVYRLCDLGLLLGAVVMHGVAHETDFARIARAPLGGADATLLGLLLLLAASGKGALAPFSGWLPRAMEGPTPSSALFYGALSVHAAIYLLIRATPIFAASPAASVAAILVGAITAASGALLARVQSDAKTALGWASVSQLGLMVVEVGFHWPRLALAHLVGHACLRAVQLLKAPNVLHDSVALRKAMGVAVLDTGTRALTPGAYRVLRDGFFVEAQLERLVVGPLLALGRQLDRAERAWTEWMQGRGANAVDPARKTMLPEEVLP
jgi:NADH-quinone oxidoreductase subunit L